MGHGLYKQHVQEVYINKGIGNTLQLLIVTIDQYHGPTYKSELDQLVTQVIQFIKSQRTMK